MNFLNNFLAKWEKMFYIIIGFSGFGSSVNAEKCGSGRGIQIKIIKPFLKFREKHF
jgi:hypothetical protein